MTHGARAAPEDRARIDAENPGYRIGMRPPTVVLLALAAGVGCDAGKTKVIGTDYPDCQKAPVAPPASVGVSSFYGKYLDAKGIPILSSAAVADQALATACTIVGHMLSARTDVRQAMIGLNMTVVVLGRNEVTTDVPEYANLYQTNPGDDWDAYRGVGATLVLPVTSAGEENLLCEQVDPFAGGNILVQVFATSVLLGLEDVDSSFDNRLQTALAATKAAGRWQGSYALINDIEYYARGVEAWFDTAAEGSPPDGKVDTRANFLAYDPGLATLVQESMPADAWRPDCPRRH
jgi:hypothetical protein